MFEHQASFAPKCTVSTVLAVICRPRFTTASIFPLKMASALKLHEGVQIVVKFLCPVSNRHGLFALVSICMSNICMSNKKVRKVSYQVSIALGDMLDSNAWEASLEKMFGCVCIKCWKWRDYIIQVVFRWYRIVSIEF